MDEFENIFNNKFIYGYYQITIYFKKSLKDIIFYFNFVSKVKINIKSNIVISSLLKVNRSEIYFKNSLKIYLIDFDKELVSCWKKEFSNIDNNDISCGNIFDKKADSIISPANSFGFMGGGIDLHYRKYFGKVKNYNLDFNTKFTMNLMENL